MGRKADFAVVFYQKKSLHEEIFIYTAKITAIKVTIKDIHKRDDKRWVVYIDSQSSITSFE